jgi:hypothetical protein
MAKPLLQNVEVHFSIPCECKLIRFRGVFIIKDYYRCINTSVYISRVFTYPLNHDEPLSWHEDVKRERSTIFQKILGRTYDSYAEAVDAINTTAESSVPIHLNLHFVD